MNFNFSGQQSNPFEDNLFKQIRQSSFLSPSIEDNYSTEPEEDDSSSLQAYQNNDDFLSRSSQALDAYKRHVNSMPDKDNYKPGKMRKVLSAIAGIGLQDPNVTQSLLDQPYNEALSKYKIRGSQLGELADLEMKDNAATIAAYDKRADNRRLDTRLKLDQDTATETKRKNDAQIARWGAQQAAEGWELKTDETTGKLVRVNKQTGVTEPFDVKVAQTAKEKDDAARGLIDYRNQGQGDLDIARWNRNSPFRETPADREAREMRTFAANRKTQVNNPIPTARPTILLPSQQNAAFTGALREMLIEHPEYNQFVDKVSGQLKAPLMESEPGRFYGTNEPDQTKVDLYNKLVKDTQDRAKAKEKQATAGNVINAANNNTTLEPEATATDVVISEFLKSKGKRVSPETIAQYRKLKSQ